MRNKLHIMFSIVFLFFFIRPVSSSNYYPEKETQEELAQEVTVTLKLIQVYVTDKKGVPVTDLTKEDFELKDNGKIKNISDFERNILSLPSITTEVQETAVAQSEPKRMPRKFFLFFDFAFNDLGGINMAKEAARHFIDSQIDPTDEVGVLAYSTHRGLVLHEYLTSDHAKIRELVNDIGIKEILGRAGRFLEEQQLQLTRGGEWSLPDAIPVPGGEQMMQRIEQRGREMREDLMKGGGMMEYRHQTLHFTSAIKDMAKALRYIPGYKHIILFSTGIPNWLMYRTSVEAAPTLNKVNIAGSDSSDMRRRYEEMSRELAAANSPVYAVNVEGMYADFMQREGRTDFQRWTFDQAQPTTGIEARNWRGITSLSNLANDTGGKYFDNTNSAEKIVEEIQTMTGSYYVLGYPISGKWDGKYHDVKVTVRREGCKVYAQRGYYNPKSFKKYSDLEKKIHLIDMALNERSHFGGFVNFPLTALPLESANRSKALIVFNTSEGSLGNVIGEKTEIVFLIFDEKQNIVGLKEFGIDNPDFFRGNVFPYVIMPLYAGKFECRVVIRNSETGRGAVASSMLFIPRSSSTGMKLYPPLLLKPQKSARYASLGRQKDESDESALLEIFPFDTHLSSPLIGEMDRNVAKVLVLTRCSFVNITDAEVKILARLVHQPSSKNIPIESSINYESGIFSFEIPTEELQPGKYFLYLFAEELKTQAKSNVNTTFTIK
ncbi:VWA domain-containing protein [Acidobacteriota bacterium]